MPMLQDVIHKLEVGPWLRYLKIGLSSLALVALVVGYNWRSFRNLGTQEAMDSAQVARNIAEGKGYSTLFIRPLSLYLVKQRNLAKGVAVADNDYSQIKINHPDLANPPVYPCALAAVLKVMKPKLKWNIDTTKAFWSKDGRFWRYQPDLVISLFNEVIMFGVILLTFFLAKRLFDPGVAWLSGILLLGSEMMWRFAVSGLSTMLLLLFFMGLVWFLVLAESEAREPKRGQTAAFLFAAGAGLMVALGMLTRYSFGWLIVPVGLFFVLFGGTRRAALCLLAVGVFAAAVTPWIYRNMKVSGMPFGTSTFAIVQGSSMFPEYKLDRALEPDFKRIFFSGFTQKLLGNSRVILEQEVPKMGGSWLTALFLAGLLLGFRNPAIRRLRYFLMFCLVMLVMVQALGRTQLSEASPELNSENLLVLLTPLLFIYGVSLFYLMLEQMNLPFKGLRYLVIGAFAAIMMLPMIGTFLPPKPTPVVYPPYYPPAIQQVAGWMKENELMMSDIPWAVAWYGHRQCIWTTLNAQEEFFAVNDLQKSVRGLYLTPETMDSRFLTQWVRAGEHSWGSFILESMLQRRIPPTFPLREAPTGFLPEQLFLTDWKRWKIEPTPDLPPQPVEPGRTNRPAK
ncbi:MAG: hypothetical protein EXS35_04965 [Pedosphaera sp.]|nr:hypothetical protein [Pedosphaera sp.]